jgi:hypothetical protein
MKLLGQKVFLSAGCLLCAAVAWKFQIDLDGSEFSGGRLTGPLLTGSAVGAVLFALTVLLVYLYPRAAALTAFSASVLCLPLYAYFAATRLFRNVFPGEYSVPPQSVGREGWSIAGILLMACIVYAFYRALWRRETGVS